MINYVPYMQENSLVPGNGDGDGREDDRRAVEALRKDAVAKFSAMDEKGKESVKFFFLFRDEV